MIFEFLRKFLELCNAYFGTFDEMNVKNNFSIIYELLDGMVHVRTLPAARSALVSRAVGCCSPACARLAAHRAFVC